MIPIKKSEILKLRDLKIYLGVQFGKFWGSGNFGLYLGGFGVIIDIGLDDRPRIGLSLFFTNFLRKITEIFAKYFDFVTKNPKF